MRFSMFARCGARRALVRNACARSARLLRCLPVPTPPLLALFAGTHTSICCAVDGIILLWTTEPFGQDGTGLRLWRWAESALLHGWTTVGYRLRGDGVYVRRSLYLYFWRDGLAHRGWERHARQAITSAMTRWTNLFMQRAVCVLGCYRLVGRYRENLPAADVVPLLCHYIAMNGGVWFAGVPYAITSLREQAATRERRTAR